MQTAGSADKPLYENREQFQPSGRHSSDLTLPYSGTRRASFDDGIYDQSANDVRQPTPANVEDDRLYQNIHSAKSTQQRGTSPTKKAHLSPISVPVPEGYYNLTPPHLVRRHNSNTASPSSSPEDETSYLSSQKDASEVVHSNVGIIGDNNKSSHKASSPPSEMIEIGGVYQNIEFMRGPNDSTSMRYVRNNIHTYICMYVCMYAHTHT